MTLLETAQLLGNFGEFVGAIAVVLTLGYLAILLDRVSEQGSLEGLSSDERLRFTAVMRANTQRFESMYFRYEAGLLQPRVWTVRRNWLSGWIKTPAMAAWWVEERESSCYTDEFIEDIESVPGISLGTSTQKA